MPGEIDQLADAIRTADADDRGHDARIAQRELESQMFSIRVTLSRISGDAFWYAYF